MDIVVGTVQSISQFAYLKKDLFDIMGKYAYLLSCQELDEKIYTTVISVR